MARQAKGTVPEATHKLLNLKYGSWVATQLEAGQHPKILAQQISDDTGEVVKDVEKRDRQGKVTGMDEVTIGPMTVTGDQLVEWYPVAAALGEPPEGHADPDDKGSLHKP